MRRHVKFLVCFAIVSASLIGCKRQQPATTAFYYWKTGFQLDTAQTRYLKNVNSRELYVRFFDVKWDHNNQKTYPNAIIRFNGKAANYIITPVIYIANNTFENIADTAIHTLARNCSNLVNTIAHQQSINYKKIQIDCDWTLTTRDKYFNFLRMLKELNAHPLQVTIRLHQIKYKDRTGVPPVDTGVLMFYNMGKLNADLRQPNSIYNKADADKYVRYLKDYPSNLNIALPLFSWALHIREGKLIQIYANVNRAMLKNNKFNPINGGNSYLAKQSFFLNGVYIKQNDIFKLEETTAGSLKIAADQLAEYLPQQQYRTVIYYDLANTDLSEFKAETLKHISDSF